MFIVLLGGVCWFTLPVSGQGRVGSFALSKGDLIEDVLFDYYDEGFNGSVLVVEDNTVIYENTFGFADFATQEPLDSKTPFYLASLAKQFTAAAIIRLAEAGKLYLDDPVTKYLPLMPRAYSQIRIYHLLTHTGGVPDYFALGIARPGLTNMDVYQALVTHKVLDFTPGNKFRYSNSGYVLLALVIQIASGQPIADYFQQQIFAPCGMEGAFIYSEFTRDKLRAKGYTAKGKPDDYNLLTVGDGGIYATARDLYNWQRALNSGEIISLNSLEKVYAPVVLANGRIKKYGYGWELGSNLQGKLVYHTGGLAGFRNYIERQLESGDTIIILTNNSFADVLPLRNTLVKILDGRLAGLNEETK